MEEQQLLEDTSSMIKLKTKSKLIKDTAGVYLFLSEKERGLSKQFVRYSRRSLLRDFKKGMRAINRKIPVYVELPKYEKKGNGMYTKETNGKPEQTASGNDIIEVGDTQLLSESNVSGLIE